eukprot:5395219-Prymnesium_polylepis.1
MAAQADAGVWQKAAPVAVEGRERAISVVSVVQRTVVYKRLILRVCPIARAPCMFGVAGVAAWRSCVCIPTPTAE